MLDTQIPSVSISLPEWVDETVRRWPLPLQSDLERMQLAVELSSLNVERGGGPFGALVFAGDICIGAGVNRVVDSGFSIAHAEILALMAAQLRWREQLRGEGEWPLTLIATTEPCCQCLGSLIWAGVQRLVCGATTDDAQSIGFDEGPKPEDWAEVLQNRGIAVTRKVHREAASAVLVKYSRCGGAIYGKR